MASEPRCDDCGYGLAGVPDRGGLVTCPECGEPQSPADAHDRRWARRTFMLGVALPNYLMAATTLLGGWLGGAETAVLMAVFIFGLTLGLALMMSRDAEHRSRGSAASRAARAVGLWALLNAPAGVVQWLCWS
ncbi:MAG: hypothetical protein DYG92_08320 [Leptolyngbya sp. PLA1]|nr:hypothetical protein [Leptolyngbya sp. PLA1]